ncbi:MAG TPA: hypothetical protein VFH15_15285 [Pyrinomonadaceae bacterium]|nr:hypothetical protein [Pyrinomonadaceae bacterium]
MARAKPPTSRSVGEEPPNRAASKIPDVIVDFVFERGLFFIAIKNISEQPAYKVSVKFSQKLYGLGGAREVSALPLFRNIEFLAPQKEIATFLDSSDSYFARKQPTKVEAQISYRDAEGDKHSVSIAHDLEIYRNLAVTGRPEGVVISDSDIDEGE